MDSIFLHNNRRPSNTIYKGYRFRTSQESSVSLMKLKFYANPKFIIFRQLFLPKILWSTFWRGITKTKNITLYWQHFASPRSQQIYHFCRVLQTASKWFSWEKTQRGEGLRWKASPGLLAVKRRRCASSFERFTHRLPGRRWWWTKEQSLTSVIGGVRKRESSQRWWSCFSHTIPSPPSTFLHTPLFLDCGGCAVLRDEAECYW